MHNDRVRAIPFLHFHRSVSRLTIAVLASTVLGGCAAGYENAVRRDLREASRALATPGERPSTALDGSEASYVAYAMAQSPDVRASYERWRAETLRIAPARQLPEPMITYAFYAAPVETRVGPQRHRLSVQQSVPWPTKLTAAADAQAARAHAAQRRFEARALAVRREVSEAWWRLWAIRRVRTIEREQLEILDGLADTIRTRLEVGEATLADVSQVDVTRSRLDDAIQGLGEEERAAEAALRAVIGAPADRPMPTEDDVPPAPLVADDAQTLREAVRSHPFLRSFQLMAEANEARASALEADRFPRFTVGLDWIETGPAIMPVTDSGQDAVIVSAGVSVPLWQEAYDDAQRAAEADASAERADGRAAEDAALAELTRALSAIRDAHRRLRLYRDTLIPQAQSAYESVIGSYAVGRSGVAAALLAQRDLLELAVALVRARADHGVAWARLERVVGRPVEAANPEPANSAGDGTARDRSEERPSAGARVSAGSRDAEPNPSSADVGGAE